MKEWANLRRSLKQIFWLCLLAASVVYLTMLTWTLPTITKAAGGNLPFDLRPMGYDIEYAKTFLDALTPAGRQLYLSAQQQLDMVYPALMAITLGLGSYLVSPLTWNFGRWIGAPFSTVGAAFDYIENHYVAKLLQWNAQPLDPELVQAASRASILKSISTTLAILVFLTLLVCWLYRQLMIKGKETKS